jgi:endonuclease/exonuclease/phosphatase family metal-dependent hydrolase
MARLRDRRAPVMRVALLALALAGCVEQTDNGSEWLPMSEMTGALVPELGPIPTARSAPGCTLRVASWNVHFGADPDDLADQIDSSTEIARADVLLIQEVEAYPTESATRTRRLAERLGMTWVYAPARVEGSGTHGIATLSRYPLEDTAVRRLPHYDQILNPRDRNALATTVVIGGDRLQIINVHLDVRMGAVDRIRQLHPAVNEIDERVVVGGDFNSNPWAWSNGIVPLTQTEAIVGQDQASVLDDYLLGKGFTSAISVDTGTMRIPAVSIRIDNLYPRGLPITAAGVEHVDGSDHWPLWMDIDRCDN